MPFEWNSLAALGPPEADEVEVTIIGRGFGECILVHVGGGRWFVVDSCIDPTTTDDRRPVAERYLRALGIAVETAIDMIVASHWHDDHVRGLGRLCEVAAGAQICCALAMTQREFIEYLEMLSTGSASTDGAKVREFSHVLRLAHDSRRKPLRFANGSKRLKSWAADQLGGGTTCSVTALSPSDKELQLFLQDIATLMPSPLRPQRGAVARSPNLASVVLHAQFSDFALLLGADMELHHDLGRGWGGALGEAKVSGLPPASLFKVSHHGSHNGHHDDVWQTLLTPRPISIVTPFNKLPLASKLPTDLDINRLQNLSGQLFIAGERGIQSRRSAPLDGAVARSLKESGITMREIRSGLGLVRLRRRSQSAQWVVETFGKAETVSCS